ncbi:Uncharacterised protein [Salmonella enterica subsp. enterica serovar Typhimurium str. DT104]|nr:Uncharacterised protein [Salmonella enterica subsp. enterica serovar Typhimurium str. DT104]CQG23512.1 Uncharacterised protein [Salmonella enterica subsp. enterica serovar Typhimurium str. DT104]
MVTRPLRQLRHGFKVVANLRQQAADINRISRIQPQRRFQFFVIKCLFHQRLARVEIAVDRHGFNVAAQRTEQFFLQRTDLTARVENDDPHIFQAIERVSHRRAGIA